MKWFLPLLLLLAGCPSSAPTPPPPPSFVWTGNGNPSIPVCTTTVTTSCLVSFTLKDVTLPMSPVVVASNIPITSYSYIMSTLPASGIHVYSLSVVGKDAVGNPVISNPATSAITIN